MKAPLILPAKPYDSRPRLAVLDDQIILSDRDWRRRIGAGALMLTFGLLGLSIVLLGAVALIALWLPGNNRGPTTDVVGGAVLFLILGLITTGTTLGLIVALQMHRRFTVHVDVLRRICVCRSWCFGLPVGRVETETGRSSWDVTTYYRNVPTAQPTSPGLAVAKIVLFLMGPLGWFISVIVWSAARGGLSRAGSEPQEFVVLLLKEDDQSQARIVLRDGGIAEAFLLAWDRMI